jgi:hypothetical protein
MLSLFITPCMKPTPCLALLEEVARRTARRQ